MRYSSWEPGQPDSRSSNGKYQTAIRLGKHGQWDDTFDDKQHPFICTHTGECETEVPNPTACSSELTELRNSNIALSPEHFIYSDTKVTWGDAINYCSFGGMTLAHDLSPEQNVAIVKLAREKSPVDDLGKAHPYLNRNWVWIGASDNYTEGVWRWTKGSKIYYNNWEKAQPDNLDHGTQFYGHPLFTNLTFSCDFVTK